MTETKPPYRAEHVGSLPRPEHLMAAREQYATGKLSKAELTRIEDACIRDAVAMQERVGIGLSPMASIESADGANSSMTSATASGRRLSSERFRFGYMTAPPPLRSANRK
jgi:methionine synthase II (cobalamin-independent)